MNGQGLNSSRRFLLSLTGLVALCVLGFVVSQGFLETSAVKRVPELDPSASGVSRPIIGIASLTDQAYVRAVRQAGGIPVVLPNADGSTDRIDDYLHLLDGLLLPGGADIPPSEYGEQAHESVAELDPDRFRFERALCKAWIERSDKPLLGICLGSQWINVASGGSLVQDIPTEYGVNHRGVSHQVNLVPQTRLCEILGAEQIEVNSSHHQAVKKLGRDLKIAASSPDGVVEATETIDPNRFLIGVQCHPERLVPDDQRQANLLKAFIEACSAHSSPVGQRAAEPSRR